MNNSDNLKRFLLTIRYRLRSRNGKIVLAITTVLCALLWIYRTSANREENEKNSNLEGAQDFDKNDRATPIQSVSESESFEFFTQEKTKPEEAKSPTTTAVPMEPDKFELPPPLPLAIETPEVFEPLIKEERQPARAKESKPEEQVATLPPLELGATVHCQLLFPATSHQTDAPVIAQVTRPVIRDGITIVPVGSKIFGMVQAAKDERLFFATDWMIVTSSGRPITMTGNSMQKSVGANDGKLGVPGFVENQPPPENLTKLLTRSLINGVAEISKDTVRTGVGEYISSSGRNAAITGGSAVIDQLLTPNAASKEKKPYVNVPAGNEFYVVVSSQERPNKQRQEAASSTDSLDGLIEEMMRKRLER